MNRLKSQKHIAVTQKDIARQAGVSSTVVSYVINHGPRSVAEKTKQRVLKAIEDLGYRPNKHAQSLKSRKIPVKHQLGIIMGAGSEFLRRPYYGDILSGIYDEAYRQGQRIRFFHFLEELHDPLLFNEHVHPEEISALIFFPPYDSLTNPQNSALIARITERISNVICLEASIADLPSVVFDRIGAARIATQHLIALRHQCIGFVGKRDNRVDGYRQALLEHGLPYHEHLLRHPGEQKNTPEEGYEGTRVLLDLAERPTAIFAASDEVALGVLGAVHDHGLRVPEDVALVSIDDLDFAPMIRPALTTVRVPRQQMGVHALRMLAMHEAYPDTQPVSVVLPTELIVRQSCGTL
ncbi:transcriptional regulator, LacI family [Candidatus Vecturithrix granuli]|uniref:Transcriptional regulator, LacI family n=1 Tax=Vecturithrix granuli TaxID=1499967 RepID=A0A081C2F9_VECG1|nr:transcriptional regulator, LacI family [Candidatus Vecturithrix granuli]